MWDVLWDAVQYFLGVSPERDRKKAEKLVQKEGEKTMPDLVARWKQIHRELEDAGLTDAQREDAASSILAAENPGVLIRVEDSSGGGVGEMPLYTVEGRVGEMGSVKFSLDALRWELGPGGAQYPNWDTDSELQIVAKFEELSAKLTKVE